MRLTVRAPKVTEGARLGDSISVNGVCLTVAELGAKGGPEEGTFTADVMRESLDRTALGELAEGSPVNLERALLPSTRMGGHLVQGHVDGTATLMSRSPAEHWDVLRFSLPDELARYGVEKGSIAVSGTSLTVSAVGGDEGHGYFEVSLIPTTLAETILGGLEVGGSVNLEVDIVAKYVEKLLAPGR